MILKATQPKVARFNSTQRNVFTDSSNKLEHLASLKKNSMANKVYSNLIDTKQFKKDMLRGQAYKILDFVEIKQPKKTFY